MPPHSTLARNQDRRRSNAALVASISLTAVAALGTVVLVEPVPTVAVPVLATLVPLLGRSRKEARFLRGAAGVVLLGFAWLGLASVGMFFLPGAVAMVIAAVRA